jgi:hypothetical protein
MITVLNKKTNELIGFEDTTSSDEIATAMKGYNYGEIKPHKQSMYEKFIEPALQKSGIDIFQPKFVFDRPEPDPVAIGVRSAVSSATFGIMKDRGIQSKFDEEDANKFIIAEVAGIKITPQTVGELAGVTSSIGASAFISGMAKIPVLGRWLGGLAGRGVIAGAEGLAEAKAIAPIATKVGGMVEGAVAGAGTGAVLMGTGEAVNQIQSEDPDWSRIGEAVLKGSRDFAIFGAVGAAIPSKTIGTATMAGVGYGLAKADGASESDAIFSGATIAMFHAFSAHGDTPEYRKKVLGASEDLIWSYLRSKSPLMSKAVIGKTANEFKIIIANEVLQEKKDAIASTEQPVTEAIKNETPVDVLEKIASSKEDTQAFIEKVAEKVLDVEPAKQEATREAGNIVRNADGTKMEVIADEPSKELTLEEAYKKKHEEVSKSIYQLKGTPDDYYTKKALHGKGMERSSVLRKLRGEPTDIEIRNELKVLNGNRIGKKVTTPDGDGVITSKPSFGKFKVNVNGTEKSYAFEDISSVMSTKEQAIESLRVKAEQEASQFLLNHGEPFVEKISVQGVKSEPDRKPSPVEAKPDDVEYQKHEAKELSSYLSSLDPGGTLRFAEWDDGPSRVIGRDKSARPKWWQDTHISMKRTTDVLDKVANGEKLTSTQQRDYDILINGAEAERKFIRDTYELNKQRKELSDEGYSEEQIDKAISDGVSKANEHFEGKKYEPWQLTRDDFAWGERTPETDAQHRIAVEQAIKDGKTIPADVLVDYPNLNVSIEKPSDVSGKSDLPASEGSKPQISQTQTGKEPGTQVEQAPTTPVSEQQTRASGIQQEGAGEVSSSKENIAQNVKESMVFKRAKEKYKGLQDQADVTYDVKTLEDQIARAMDMSEKDPVRFKKIALGQMNAPEGVTDTAVNIVYAEKMLAEGNNAEAFRAIRNHSLKQTERGQEIAMENARATNVNDAQAFIQKVIEAKMMNAGKKLYEFSTREKTGSAKKATTEKIKEEVKRVKEVVDKKQLDIDEAQKLIDELGCK